MSANGITATKYFWYVDMFNVKGITLSSNICKGFQLTVFLFLFLLLQIEKTHPLLPLKRVGHVQALLEKVGNMLHLLLPKRVGVYHLHPKRVGVYHFPPKKDGRINSLVSCTRLYYFWYYQYDLKHNHYLYSFIFRE